MRRTPLIWAGLLVACIGGMLAAPALSQAQAPPPQPPPGIGSLVAGSLSSPRGLKMGPDGMLYVAEAGSGGATDFTLEGQTFKNGLTGRISKINPTTGARTTVIENLPSQAGGEGDAVGPADVAFIGDQLYYVQTHGGADWGFPGTPTGVYRVNADATATLIADIGAFNKANPVTPIKNGSQQDIEPGGNPYAMISRGGSFYVTDGNQNQVMKVDLDGTITRVSDFPTHIVSTGIASGASGPLYVSTLGAFPFTPEDGRIYQVGFPTGTLTQIASGTSFLTGVAVGNGGQVYALQAIHFNAETEQPDLGTGKLLKVNADGTMTPLVTGFNGATAVIIVDDTAYISDYGIFGSGTIWKVPNVSGLSPITIASPTAVPSARPAATATPRGGITGPDTGTGTGAAAADGISPLALALAAAAALTLLGAGTALRLRRR